MLSSHNEGERLSRDYINLKQATSIPPSMDISRFGDVEKNHRPGKFRLI